MGVAASAVIVAITEIEVRRVSGVPGVPSVGVGPGVNVCVGVKVSAFGTASRRDAVGAMAEVGAGVTGVLCGAWIGLGVNVTATTLPAGIGVAADGLVTTGVAMEDWSGLGSSAGVVAHAVNTTAPRDK